MEETKFEYQKPLIKDFAWDMERQDNIDGKDGISWSSFRNDSACASVSPVVVKEAKKEKKK